MEKWKKMPFPNLCDALDFVSRFQEDIPAEKQIKTAMKSSSQKEEQNYDVENHFSIDSEQNENINDESFSG